MKHINQTYNLTHQRIGDCRLHCESGFVLISTYFLLAAMLALIAAYNTLVNIELASTKFSKDGTTGFYAAEAGLNLRAEEIRDIFIGYNRPSGTSPDETNPCEGGNMGSDAFACQTARFNNRDVITYVTEDPSNPISLTIPPGERYQNLNAQEYRYTVRSVSKNIEGNTEAVLELRFKSRLVPLFQFVAFYNKDLEILPGPVMNLSGPIHTNGDLYMDAGNQLNISGQVTTAGALFRGRKNDSSCKSNQVAVIDPVNLLSVLPTCPTRTAIPSEDLTPWNGMIERDVPVVTVPEPEDLNPSQGELYWDKADIRVALQLDGSGNPITNASSSTGVYVYNTDETVNNSMTGDLDSCSGGVSGKAVGTTNSFYNNREGDFTRTLEIDMGSLLNCLHTTNWLGENNKLLDDDTEGGLVFYFTVFGNDSGSASNHYGVRLQNAETLQSNVGGAPLVRGLTVVSDQAVYTYGNYNGRMNDPSDKIPAAILADAFNPLSNNWNINDSTSTQSVNNRVASDTAFNAAVLSGTNTTGGIEGAGGQGGTYNGGLENYPRFHEKWSSRTFQYRGSFVSLNNSQHQNGAWVYGNPQYTAPNRDWDYDTDFNDASNLPPLTPRFVYLRQELFVRDFEQD
jgi:hypothetical protein